MKMMINRMLQSLAVSVAIALSATAAPVSTPYLNTFADITSTNDFVIGGSPANKIEYVQWWWQATISVNYMRCSNAQKTLYGWSTLDFQDLGGSPSTARNFSFASKTKRKTNPASSVSSRGEFGFCVLADEEDLTNASFYYARVYFTNVVGYIRLSKYVGGIETVLTNETTTITYGDNSKTYDVNLQGVYEHRKLTLTYSLSYDSETNTLSYADKAPLEGSRFGFYAMNNSGGAWTFWDDLSVDSWVVPPKGTVIVVK